ncbi:MAG: FtsQ-type POTRA domain-containing protein [Clostridia bacterium]|nr:FtsQ-type POTRA domain-containing protein [Clostridia bacterium]
MPNNTEEKMEYEGFERLRRKKTVRHIKRRVFTAVLLVFLCVVFFVLTLGIFFRISEISVTGNDVYNDQDIIEMSGIEYGTNIYLLDTAKVSDTLKREFPYIKRIKLERDIPQKIILNLECDTAVYYVEICGEYFAVSRDLRVLERTNELETLTGKYPEIKRLLTSDVEEAIVGRTMLFTRANYYEAVTSFLALLEASECFEGLTTVDVSDRFSINLIHNHRIKASIGDPTDAELKLRFLYEVLKDLGDQSATVDVENVEMAYVILTNGETYD